MKNVEQFIAAYETALATQDWEQISPLIHDDCVATFSEGTYIGKPEVEAAFRRTFALIKDETYKISNLHWALKTDSVAVASYQFHWSGLINGVASSGGGRGTSTIIPHKGKWVLIAEHLGPHARK